MQTVTRETAQKMKEKGWVKETHFTHRLFGNTWVLVRPGTPNLPDGKDIPAATPSELLEEIEFRNLIAFYEDHETISFKWDEFAFWLYTTMRDPDALARVWLRKEAQND